MKKEGKLRIAFIGIKGLPAKAGVDRVVEALVRRCNGYDIEPTVYCDKRHTSENYQIPGCEIKIINSFGGKYIQAPIRFLFATIHALFWGDYDLIHLHNIETSYLLPLLRLRYPVISTAHGFAYWRTKWGKVAKKFIRLMDWPFVKLSNVATSVSLKDAEELNKRYGKKVNFIPNGVSLDYEPNNEKAKGILDNLGLCEGDYAIFVAGRIEPTKGAHIAIEAVNQLQTNLQLLIVGDLNQIPEYGKHLKNIANKNTYFHPLISDKETLFGLMRGSLFLIFPSTVEAMSMVLLETASLGVPIIASDIKENRYVLGADAIYFNVDDAESLREQLRWALSNHQSITLQAKNAKQRIHEEYDWDKIFSQYEILYRKIVN